MNKLGSAMIHLLGVVCVFNIGVSKSDISIGYQMSLTVPSEYSPGFVGKALLMESDKNKESPNYQTALSVEATEEEDQNHVGRFSCSLDLFLGTVKVWSSGHRSKFYASEMCVLELTHHGDLRLKDSNDHIGWRTGTTGQGVQKLKLLETGNMVLVDSAGSIKWQTFNFPTDVLVVGQRLSVATHLISENRINGWFYSLEIRHDKLGLYLNTGNYTTTTTPSVVDINNNNSRDNKNKYSYWEFDEPSETGRNITFVELTSQGLSLFDDAMQAFAHIYIPAAAGAATAGAIRFLALDSSTGNLGLYYYNSSEDKFKACFEALNSTCDLPLACSASNYTVCTRTGACSCIRPTHNSKQQELQVKTAAISAATDCGRDLDVLSTCGDGEMVEMEGVVSVLRSVSWRGQNMSKGECGEACTRECPCMAAMYGRQLRGECELYGVVSGMKETVSTSSQGGGILMLKLPKPPNTAHNKLRLGKWVLVLILASDGLLLLLVAAGLVYFFLWKTRTTSS